MSKLGKFLIGFGSGILMALLIGYLGNGLKNVMDNYLFWIYIIGMGLFVGIVFVILFNEKKEEEEKK